MEPSGRRVALLAFEGGHIKPRRSKPFFPLLPWAPPVPFAAGFACAALALALDFMALGAMAAQGAPERIPAPRLGRAAAEGQRAREWGAQCTVWRIGG